MSVLSIKRESYEVNIVETQEISLREPLVILGFAGAGLVGGIAVTHIIDQLKIKEIAHVQSRYISNAVVFIDGKLRQPFRIYSSEEGTLCAVVCEIPLPSDSLYPITQALLDWAEQKGVKELVVLEGVAFKDVPEKREVFCVAEPEKCTECEERGVRMLSAGVIGGLAGSMLNATLERKITGVALLVPALPHLPDPEGASALVDTLNKLYSLNVGIEDLLKKVAEIKGKLREVAERHRRMVEAEEKRGESERLYVA